jgi:hypothetical protein
VRYRVTMRLTAAEDHDNLESSIDRIMEELVRLTEVDLTVNAAEEDVTKVAVTAIRTAIHAVGQGTPGWPAFEEA